MIGARRTFLRTAVGGLLASIPGVVRAQKKEDHRSLAGEVGITTGSFMRHLPPEPQAGKLCLLDLPRIMRDELGLRVIDLMTATLVSLTPEYLDRLRAAAEKAGCVLTNLKMNLKGLDLDSPDPKTRAMAMAEYRRTIDAAARLGVRWARPLPGDRRPDLALHVASYRELIEYAAPRKIQLLIENNGWMRSDPDAIPTVIKAVDRNLAASPDTGNWQDNEVRYAGLAKAFPLAATCDFKALVLGPDGAHAAYDLKRCFQIGWDAGFRGPWCLEHFHDDLKTLLREMGLLRDLLRRWMAERK
jgi:hypothetical protein